MLLITNEMSLKEINKWNVIDNKWNVIETNENNNRMKCLLITNEM